MAFGYPQYPGVYQPQVYPQMGQPQNQMMMQNPQQPPMQNQTIQPVPPIQPMQAQAMAQNNGIIWVGSKGEADNWPVDPGCAIALWDKNSPETRPVLYLRQADSTGRPSTKVYDLVERTNVNSFVGPAMQIDPNNIVTWDKLDEYLSERLKKPSRPVKPKEDTDNG